METSARLAIEIADHHLASASVEKRRALALAIHNAISVCEREVAMAFVGRPISAKDAAIKTDNLRTIHEN